MNRLEIVTSDEDRFSAEETDTEDKDKKTSDITESDTDIDPDADTDVGEDDPPNTENDDAESDDLRQKTTKIDKNVLTKKLESLTKNKYIKKACKQLNRKRKQILSSDSEEEQNTINQCRIFRYKHFKTLPANAATPDNQTPTTSKKNKFHR